MYLDSVQPDISLVGDGNVVISYELVDDEENDSITWLEIYANDLRENAPGLLGLELDLSWDSSISSIEDSLYQLKNVFNANKLPLFRNKGLINNSNNENNLKDNRTYLTGLGAASLPKANQGEILGISDESNNNSLFARLPFRNLDDKSQSKNNFDLNIEIKLMPQVGGEIFSLDEVLVLDNKAPLVNVIRANPNDEHIKSYAFSISDANQIEEAKNIILSVREINDIPQSISGESDIKLDASQDYPLFYNLSDQFFDRDDIKLEYELKSAPNWIILDEETNTIIGTPKNINVGENLILVSASDNRGGVVEKEIKIIVQNINDTPFVNKEILLPEIFQDQKLDLIIPKDSFDDPDLLVSSQEKLNFEVFDKNGMPLKSDFIYFDKGLKKLSFNPKQIDVGSHEFKVRATDIEGKYAEQLLTLKVKNKNDAPVFTEELEIFKSFQSSSLDLNLVSSEDSKNLIFIETEKIIDVSKWVKDFDTEVDINELLNYRI